jgi:hypothetical protein
MFWGPVEGQFVGDELLPAMGGAMRPEADVALNGMPMETSGPYPQIWEYPDVWQWGVVDSTATWGDVLDEGPTVVTFRAETESGEVLVVERGVTFDPRLQLLTGWLVSIGSGDPPTATVEIATIEPGDDDDTVVVGDTYQLVLTVPADAAFILLETPNEGNLPDTVMGREDFFDLAASVASGEELTDYFYSYLFGVPSELWLSDTDGLQQLKQIWTP